MCSTHIINGLEENLKEYDKVLLLTEPYFSLDILNNTDVDKKILIMSKENISLDINGVDFMRILYENEKEIVKLYYTYEFSDCFKVMSDSPHSFGGVLNLYRKGILTKEDVAKIFFY